ncbi:DNA polymerase subunit Cdc27-domain-containing protein [Mucidula mucida]|nr:DNA polymerase subunit Cdc27-domain-containing protein [Mucidula mucida]
MSTQAIDDYLTKQISIENNIVTCRSLSRALGLHVNVAKNELAAYFSKAETRHDTLFATYRLTGTLRPEAKNHTDAQDEDGYSDSEVDPVYETESTLVPGTELPAVKAQYSKVFSLYIYSLSPSEIRDCGLICNSESVRSIDRAKGDDFAKTVGKIVGDNIKVVPEKLKKGVKSVKEPVAGPSKVKPGESNADLKSKNKPATESPEPTTKKSVITKDSKLDFFKAKPKAKSVAQADAKEALAGKLTAKAPAAFFKSEQKDSDKTDTKPVDNKIKADGESTTHAPKVEKKETKSAKVKGKALLSESESEAPSTTKAKKEDEPKRLVKRKSEAVESEAEDAQVKRKRRVSKRKSPVSDSDDEDDRLPSKVTRSLSNKRDTKRKLSELDSENDATPSKENVKTSNILDSDDEEDAPIVRRKRNIKKAIPVEHDSDLEAMMAMDDDDVVRISRDKAPSLKGDDSDMEQDQYVMENKDEDDMDIDVPPVPKKKTTRKPKVVIPVGKNGLRKRRMVKQRTTQDAKGYDVTEDYSSWESVTEEEAPEPKRAKPKPRPKAKIVATKPTETTTKKKETGESDTKLSIKPKPAKKAAPKKGQQNISSFFGKKK